MPPAHPVVPLKPDCETVSLEIHLPTFGTIFMKPPDDPLWPHTRSEDLPRDDQLLSGLLEIHVPSTALGIAKRCKSIRVGIRTTCRLNMSSGRGWEEDTIFERKVELLGGNSDGIILSEGIQLFEFTLILPSSLAPHDWHPDGKVTQEIFAELEGVAEPKPPSFSALSLFGFGRRRSSGSSHSSKRPSDLALSRRSSTSSTRSSAPKLSPMLTEAGPLSMTRQEAPGFSFAPTYNNSQAADLALSGSNDHTDEWIKGTIEKVRSVMVMHNPNPSGDASDLDIRQNGLSAGVGIWDLKICSDVFSIGGPISVSFNLPSLKCGTTIFAWRLVLRQTHTITSPRDDGKDRKPISTFKLFVIAERGVRPLYIRNPGLEHPAVWRGVEAGGADTGECLLSAAAVMPRDDCGRPTTLPGLVTPIKVFHTIWYQLFFSVWGEDDKGKPMATPGPGGLRSFQISKALILPSCALIPSLLDLPKYQRSQVQEPRGGENDPSEIPICLDCTLSTNSQPQHTSTTPGTGMNGDNHKKSHACRVTLCAECGPKHDSTEFGMHGWKLCACGLAAGDIAERMGLAGDPQPEEADARGRKEAAERGDL